jgi:hypothetical protein
MITGSGTTIGAIFSGITSTILAGSQAYTMRWWVLSPRTPLNDLLQLLQIVVDISVIGFKKKNVS